MHPPIVFTPRIEVVPLIIQTNGAKTSIKKYIAAAKTIGSKRSIEHRVNKVHKKNEYK